MSRLVGAGDVQAWLMVTDPATGAPTVFHVYDGVTVNVDVEQDLPALPWVDARGDWRLATPPRHRITIECSSFQTTVGARVVLQDDPPPPFPTIDDQESPDDQPDPQDPEPGRCTKWCCAEEDRTGL